MTQKECYEYQRRGYGKESKAWGYLRLVVGLLLFCALGALWYAIGGGFL